MGKLRPVHLIEALAWLTIAAVFFFYSFEFNQKWKYINLAPPLGRAPSY